MFKFGFSDPAEDNPSKDDVKPVEEDPTWLDAEEIPLFKMPNMSKSGNSGE